MKLTVVFLTVVSLGVSARGFSQTVTYSGKNVSIEKVFSIFQQQTGYSFFYNDADLDKVRPVSVSFDHINLKEALNKMLKDRNLGYTIQGKTIFVHTITAPHKIKVSEDIRVNPIEGVVVDSANGEPLAGVTIKVRGSTIGTTTDAEGKFSLEVPEGAVLEVSYLGYESEVVSVNGKDNIRISLSETTTGLEQLVVVGYGTQKKENLTGAVDQINADDIALRPSGTINGTLQGLMPGLHIQMNNGDPNSYPDLNVRGFNSINGGAPLTLIDGIEGNLEDVNPMDIESVTVLKDASSAAIYGARAAFGVILVKTKSGQEGDIKVSYSNNFGWMSPTTRTDYISDPYEFAQIIDKSLYGYNGTSYTNNFTDLDWATLKMVADGEIAPFYEKQPDGTNKFFYKTDWYDYLFKKYQPTQFHNISVSGGTNKITGYLSGRIYDRATIYRITPHDMKRYNLNAKLSFKPVEWLELSTNIKYAERDHWLYGGSRDDFGSVWGTRIFRDLFPWRPNIINGIPVSIARDGGGGAAENAALEDGNTWRHYNKNKNITTFGITLTPLAGLELKMNYSNDVQRDFVTHHEVPFETLSGLELKDETIGINRIAEYRYRDKYKNLNAFGTYSLSIKNSHNFKLMLGYTQESFDRDRVSAEKRGLLIDDEANLSFGTEMYAIDGSTLDWALESYFGRFNYDYKGKYLLEIDSRYDGSSRFPQSSRWGLFPSLSVGWRISNENFWKQLKNYASSFKLRGSYGKLGNQSIPVNTFLELIGVGQSSWLVNGKKLISAGTPNPLPSVVTWESTKTLDFGVDVGFMDNKLLASFDWYKRETDNMYLPGEPLPSVFGASEPKENYASLVNKGFELSLTYNNSFQIGEKYLHLKATANVSNFRGIITKFNNSKGLMSTFWEGMKLGEIWGYHVEGQFQSDEEAARYQAQFQNPSIALQDVYKLIMASQMSEWQRLRAGDPKYIDLNGDGEISKGDNTLENHGDLIPIGNAMPKFPFGFNISGSYSGFDLSIAGAGVGHQDWSPFGFNYWGPYNRPYPSFIRKDLVANAWTEDHHGKYPQIYRGYTALGAGRSLYEPNDYYLVNVGFLRVKNLTVGYTIPNTLTRKVFIQKARIYLSGENLATIRFGDLTRYIDPEQAGSGIGYGDPNNATGRSDAQAYPLNKTYSFGIQLTF